MKPRRYTSRPCDACGRMRSSNGLALASHLRSRQHRWAADWAVLVILAVRRLTDGLAFRSPYYNELP